MLRATYYTLECPTCGRRVQVRVEYLGKQVACQHCRGEFRAYDPDNVPAEMALPLVARAEALLASTDMQFRVRY